MLMKQILIAADSIARPAKMAKPARSINIARAGSAKRASALPRLAKTMKKTATKLILTAGAMPVSRALIRRGALNQAIAKAACVRREFVRLQAVATVFQMATKRALIAEELPARVALLLRRAQSTVIVLMAVTPMALLDVSMKSAASNVKVATRTVTKMAFATILAQAFRAAVAACRLT